MKAMKPGDEAIICCMRVGESTEVITGSTIKQCWRCGHAVHFAPSSALIFKLSDKVRIFCNQCALADARVTHMRGEEVRVSVMREQKQEIEAYLRDKKKL